MGREGRYATVQEEVKEPVSIFFKHCPRSVPLKSAHLCFSEISTDFTILEKHRLSHRHTSSDLWPVGKVSAYWAELTIEKTSPNLMWLGWKRILECPWVVKRVQRLRNQGAEKALYSLALWPGGSLGVNLLFCRGEEFLPNGVLEKLRGDRWCVSAPSSAPEYMPFIMLYNHHLGRMRTGPWSRLHAIVSQLPL